MTTAELADHGITIMEFTVLGGRRHVSVEIAGERFERVLDLRCEDDFRDLATAARYAADCPNPNVGTWIDRATGWPIRRLHCIAADGTCPNGGRFPQRPGLADSHNGRCCLDLRATP